MVLLPKPNRDPTSVKGWRPIALLSCLGKGLERLLAKRMSFLAIKHHVVAEQQFGALPGRSATDLVGCVTHDIERARQRGQAATFVTLDVQGAFDAVLHNRLLRRLQMQGWPAALVSWCRSFLHHRRVEVRHTGGVTQPRQLECGLPQGSPISPILFLLYMAEALKGGMPGMKFSYADDIGILGIGPTAATSLAAAQSQVDWLLQWATANAVAFDVAKTEVIQFGRARGDRPGVIRMGNTTINASQSVRWLGVWLDSGLTFRHHVDTWAAKAARTTGHLRRFCNSQRGVPVGLAVKAVKACTLPVLMYGADVWWPGPSRPTSSGTRRYKHTQGLVNKIDTVLKAATKAAIPAWRTAQTAALHRECGIPPADLLLHETRLSLATRISSLDVFHPLRRRAFQPHSANKATRVQRARDLLPPSDESPHAQAPYFPPEPRTHKPKKVAAEEAGAWITSLPSNTVAAYADGASSGNALSAWGTAIYCKGLLMATNSGPLAGGEICDAELVALQEALDLARQAAPPGTNEIALISDSRNSLDIALGKPAKSSSSRAAQLRQAILTCGYKVSLNWVPAHAGITGNEMADQLAKGALPTSALGHYFSQAAIYRKFREDWKLHRECWWEGTMPRAYRGLGLPMGGGRPEHSLHRTLFGHLFAERSGHGDFAQYHRRFGHTDADLHCECGREKAPRHFGICRLNQPPRSARNGQPPAIEHTRQMLGPKGHKSFMEFAAKTECFGDQSVLGP